MNREETAKLLIEGLNELIFLSTMRFQRGLGDHYEKKRIDATRVKRELERIL